MTDHGFSACLYPMHWPLHFLLALSLVTVSFADEKKMDKDKASSEEKQSVTKYHKVTIDGKEIEYAATTSEISLKNDKGEEQATIFHVSYVNKRVKDISQRPVLFAFNGGPGSSAIWLHLGALGPRILPTSTDGTEPIDPSTTVVENPFSILDVADLVFVDPVSTGFSRAKEKDKAKQYHGVSGDVDSMADFIRLWITENKRWSSPKYLLGESYGAMRVAGLSSRLQQRYGLQLNGVILLSGVLDFSTLRASDGNDLSYTCFLPTLTATAHHHGKLKGNLSTLVKEAQEFADTEYKLALHQGHTLDNETKTKVAKRLSELTSLPQEWILQNHLRISASKFRKELLRNESKTIGRFDSRVAWDAINSGSEYPNYDPSYSVIYGPISTALLDYLGRDLGWKDDRVYEVLTGKVHPWKWGSENSVINVTDDLANAMKHNPKLRILVQCGRTDLATPAEGILYSLDHTLIPDSQRKNISVEWYDAGHMFYLNQPDLEKMRKDLVKFITQP